jgi:ABC-2 type transport system ATP-binding protein
MLTRLGLAQSLINDPQFLILDEPMSGLDPLGRKMVRELLINLKRQGKTIFFSSHILADIEGLCDRLAILHHGKIAALGEPEKLLKRGQSLEEFFVETVLNPNSSP